ncbi:beta-1,6-N-acetylglucosaminyltransferase [Salinimicrobium sediminilitoris]|uniref:beta-1,6-N-acetylglucosaminyltransferase n=1 Tax=Salinimicrobium sediminilitoris TaxID=2876715 RepID=UPI002FCF4DD7|nr:beta-1,6-N-acetylglucosaminyltransferase [Salinimicrobium sediminilitoris]
MDLNYIILAHKNPIQLGRLILRLQHPGCRFYVHIDRNVEISPFLKELADQHQIFFLKEEQRQSCIWGDIGIVTATINAMRQVVEEERSGYCILLSGQDYPLRPNKEIQDFLENENGTSFISTFSLPHPNWKNGFDRIEKYKIDKTPKRKHFLQLSSIFDKDFYSLETAGKLNFLRKSGRAQLIPLVLKKRRFPSYLKPYGGGQWWALPMLKVKEILNFIDEHPDYLVYHKYTLIPDEIFFHSIMATLDGPVAPSLTYVNWDRKNTPLPVTFEKEDLEELKLASVEKLFARKFDITIDTTILDLLDQELLQ